MGNRARGIFGENVAVKYLESRNYEILARNFTSPFGEIDIVAKDSEVFVFVEVKLRKSTAFGNPFEAVNKAKQERIFKTSFHFIEENNLNGESFRFDIIELFGGEELRINHIVNAFYPT